MLIIINSVVLTLIWICIGLFASYNIIYNNDVNVNKIKDFSVVMYTISTIITILEIFLI